MREGGQRVTLDELGLTATRGAAARGVSGLTINSAAVRGGDLFAAVPGTSTHGAHYALAALEAGAAAILTDPEGARLLEDSLKGQDVALIVTLDPRAAFARAAALWFGAQPPYMAAVTGTNGKTSVASFTRQIWELLGESAISIGTTGVDGAITAPSRHTTPDAMVLHEVLVRAAAAGATYGVMEASSHGLDQCRMEGVRLSAAAFVNLTQDHLDYHVTMEAYFEAKARLFTQLLPESGIGVINISGAGGAHMAARTRAAGRRVITVGYDQNADLQLLAQRYDTRGQDVRLSWEGQIYVARLALIGGFQAENVALAAALVLSMEGAPPPADVFAVLAQLEGVRGRMQLAARRRNGGAVYVDYAHTPDAVETALKALRPHVLGRIIIVLGAGGERDRSKRALMGAAAARHADMVIVTDDNPRSEDPAAIRAEILHACPDALEVGDRAEAILRGADALEAGDALLIAGKGHESGQIIAGQTYPFDDTEQASLAVAVLDGMI